MGDEWRRRHGITTSPETEGFFQPRERHPDSKRFHDILEELGELHDRKQADYGQVEAPFYNVESSANWGIEPWVGAMVRMTDKVNRLQSLVKNGSLANEAAEDSLLDIAVYAVIALVLREKAARE
jgi:hypothetical protein